MSAEGGAGGAIRLRRGALVSSLAILGSRMMGLVREQIFAFFFGASREYDAFLTAFRIPNLLRDLLAEGALSSAFVSTYVQALRHGKARAFAVANAVVNALVLLLAAISVLAILFCEPLVRAMAMGFSGDKLALTVGLTRLMFPFIVFVAIAAVAMGMLNAMGRHAIPQSASTVFNMVSIAVGLGCAWGLAPAYMAGLWQGEAQGEGGGRAMLGMALGTLAGGVAQWWVQMPALWAEGYRWRPRLAPRDPDFQRVLRLMGPAVIGAAAVQLNVFVNSNFASTLGDRAMSWLAYAFRLMQFPIGVFGVAIMTAALPPLARAAAEPGRAGFAATLTQALELVSWLTLPSAVGLAVLGEPIVATIFEHGRFVAADTVATARALAAYAVGLPAYAALKILQPAYVALGDARLPMRVSLATVAVNAAANLALVGGLHAGHVGLALSTSLMALVNTGALLAFLHRRAIRLEGARLAGQVGRMGLATAAVGAVAVATRLGVAQLGGDGLTLGHRRPALVLAIGLPLCAAVYVGMTHALGVAATGEVAALMRRRGLSRPR